MIISLYGNFSVQRQLSKRVLRRFGHLKIPFYIPGVDTFYLSLSSIRFPHT